LPQPDKVGVVTDNDLSIVNIKTGVVEEANSNTTRP
jgi:hypothetical protein